MLLIIVEWCEIRLLDMRSWEGRCEHDALCDWTWRISECVRRCDVRVRVALCSSCGRGLLKDPQSPKCRSVVAEYEEAICFDQTKSRKWVRAEGVQGNRRGCLTEPGFFNHKHTHTLLYIKPPGARGSRPREKEQRARSSVCSQTGCWCSRVPKTMWKRSPSLLAARTRSSELERRTVINHFLLNSWIQRGGKAPPATHQFLFFQNCKLR